ncbi:MAG: hypothetical protein QME06_07475 [Desulfobacterales bacterium]|nr:hypothetical protein [Desulfobacterales bacterium]
MQQQFKKDYRGQIKKKNNTGRKCKICGKDPYPNYFYCPACHHRISHHDENDNIIKIV